MSERSNSRKPKITLSTTDHDRLSALAATISRRDPDIAEALQTELSRAKLVAEDRLLEDVVRIGSNVTYQVDEAAARTVRLVYPADADIDAGRVSILTPIGTALLGLSPGQTMPWTTTSGQLRRLLIVAVHQDAADGNDVGGAGRVTRGLST